MHESSERLSLDSTTAGPRSPLRELLALALPTVAQMASYTVMQFCDALQLASGAGDTAATAAGMAGFLVFTLMAWGFGALLVVNTLVSQTLGAGDKPDCGRYLWQGAWFGLGFGLLLLPSMPFAGAIFRTLGHGPELVGLEILYYNWCIFFTPVRLVALAFAQFLLAIGRPNVTLVAAASAAAVNIFGNWVLINGHLGFPRLGVTGAAIATNVGVLTELLILAGVALSPAIRRVYRSNRWRLDRPAMRKLLKIGVPGGFQTVSEVVAWFLFAVWILNVFGQDAITANNYMLQYMKVSFMPAFGISAAVTALVGRYIGARQPDVARHRAHLGFKVTAVYMLVCGLVFFLGRNTLIAFFSDDPDVIRIGGALMIVAAVYQLFDGLYIIYIGALRGAGDTFVPAVATATLCWVITVGGGYAVAHLFPQLGAVGPWLAAMVYGVILGLFLLARFHRGQWQAVHLDPPTASTKLNDSTPATDHGQLTTDPVP
jgi:MATE family multidrug resistance protein